MCVCARVCETRASCYILSLFHTHTLKHTSHLKCIFRVGLLWCCTSQPTRYLKKIFFPEYLHSWQSNQISSNSINALATIAYKSNLNRTSRPRAKKMFQAWIEQHPLLMLGYSIQSYFCWIENFWRHAKFFNREKGGAEVEAKKWQKLKFKSG